LNKKEVWDEREFDIKEMWYKVGGKKEKKGVMKFNFCFN